MFDALNDIERRILDFTKKYASLTTEYRQVTLQHQSLQQAHQDLLTRLQPLQAQQQQLAQASEQSTQALATEQKLREENQRLMTELKATVLKMEKAEGRLAQLLQLFPADSATEASPSPPANRPASTVASTLQPQASSIEKSVVDEGFSSIFSPHLGSTVGTESPPIQVHPTTSENPASMRHTTAEEGGEPSLHANRTASGTSENRSEASSPPKMMFNAPIFKLPNA
jgi:uncharacterized phage infection (PIP) family protein YhgE